MIIAVLAFIAGAILSTITAVLYHQERIRVMRRDVVAALADQANDSYRTGYMRATIEQSRRSAKLAKDRETYEKTLV